MASTTTRNFDGVMVTADFEVFKDDEEIKAYITLFQDRNPKQPLKGLEIKYVDQEYVDVKPRYLVIPFDRIRRITGYLVGTLDRFNDAKRQEESMRVKHAVPVTTTEEE
jgi:hypothetical protein